MDKYCEEFKGGGKCKYINKYVPKSYCEKVCKRYKLPSAPKLVKNFAKATAKHILNRGRLRDSKDQKKILEICRECDRFILQGGRPRCRHNKCGCYLRRKVKWASEHCPENKW